MPETNSSKHEGDRKFRKASSTGGWGLQPGTEGPVHVGVSASSVGSNAPCELCLLLSVTEIPLLGQDTGAGWNPDEKDSCEVIEMSPSLTLVVITQCVYTAKH